MVLLPAAALRADNSAAPPPVQRAPEVVLGRMLEILAAEAEGDEASPVKAPTGVKNYSGSNTIVRSALSFGILAATGHTVEQSWANTPELIGSALAFYNDANQKNLEAGFQKLFGRALVKSRAGSGDNTLYAYDAGALDAAFGKLYLPPDRSLGGVRARVVYDTLLKKWVAQKADAIAELLSHKALLVAAARELPLKMKAKDFDGATWTKTLAEKLPESLRGDWRLVGTIVRRQADGSLPALVKMLRRVLTDYDPKTLERLDAKLRAPS